MKYAWAPLAEAMRISEHDVARWLGVSGSTEQEYRRDGMSEKVAERMAVKAGFHPYVVWPEMARHVADEMSERVIAEAEARRERDRARWRRAKAKAWATDPEYRERRKAYLREYKASAPSYFAAQKLRWRQENLERARAQNRDAMRRLRARRRGQGAA